MTAPIAELTAAKRAMREQAIALRTKARERHGVTTPEAAMSARLAGAGLVRPADVVSGYLAIGDEISALAVLDGVGRGNGPVALPVMVAKAQPLVFRLWSEGETLVDRMWGIREPATNAPEVLPDILLVPLLAFDSSCRRLGYGGGFFDRTLALLRATKSICAIGVAFDEVQVDTVPHAAYDEDLDYVLTPTRLVRSSPSRIA